MADEPIKTAQAPADAAPDTKQPDSANVESPAVNPPVTTSVTPEPKKDAAAEPAPVAKEEPKKDEPKKDEPAVLKKEDLKLPEGSLLDPKVVEEIAALANAKKLSKEDAQGLLERESKAVSSYVVGEQAKAQQMQDQWYEQSKGDKEFGGEAYEANVELGNRVRMKFGTPELDKLLKDSGGQFHPEVQRLFIRLGKAMAPDQLVIAGAGESAGVKPPRLADRLYAGSSDKKEAATAE